VQAVFLYGWDMAAASRIRKWLVRATLALTGWFLLHSAIISWDGCSDSPIGEPADAIVILGNAVHPDGTPANLLRSRLDKAVELFKHGAARKIICSGGIGPNGVPEGDAMRADLIAHGIDPSVIIVDNAGKDTYNTAQNTRRIFTDNNWTSALIVSNFTHISRCKLAFRRVGLTDVRCAHANFAWRDFKAFPHEFVGYYYYLVRSY